MKLCRECEVVKLTTEFYRQPKAADGLMYICKGCHKARVIHRSRTNPAVQAYDRERAKRPAVKARIERNAAKWIKTHPEKANIDRKRNPEKAKARIAVGNALRSDQGRTPKLFKGPCEVCGTTEKITAHHDDYARPLDVRWLCAQHHADLHPKWHRPYIVEIDPADLRT